MRRTLKLLLLLGIGLALAKKKNGDGITPGDGDNSIDPTTGKPKTDEQRKKDTDYNGTSAQDNFDGVMEAGDQQSQKGRNQGQGADSTSDPNGNGSNPDSERKWDADQLGNMPNLGNIPENRQVHILDGEWDYDTGELLGGGHAPGAGNPGKTEFPERWSDETIMDNISDVARNPGSDPAPRPGGGYRVTGVVDGVEIEVLLNRDGTVWSAYPLSGDGVVFN